MRAERACSSTKFMRMVTFGLSTMLLVALEYGAPAAAQAPPKEWSTDHTIRIGGRSVSYKAVASLTPITDERGTQRASIFSVEYTQSDTKDPSERPITFLYNGGPGMSSVWLHLGTFGPRRVVTTEAAATPPAPYKLADNPYCLLDRTDLVFIDPVGTGLSRAVAGAQDRDFWGVDQDVKAFADFISGYLRRHDRWNSPKFLIGESYGSFRSAALANYLYSQDAIQINGIVLISPVLDLSTIAPFNPSADLPCILSLPTYAAVAWYYKRVADPPAVLENFLTQARQFAVGDYAAALREGWRLTDREKSSVAKTLAHFTGLKEEYLNQANLRVSPQQFATEFEGGRGLRIGTYDARFSSSKDDLPSEGIQYDPSYSAVSGAFTSAMNSYLRDDLKVAEDSAYRVVSIDASSNWDWKRSSPSAIPVSPNVKEDLTRAMIANPYLQVQIENGYFDLVAPFFATEYTLDHLSLPRDSGVKAIHEKYYEAGHMMYLREKELARLKENVASLIDAASRQ